MYATCHLTRRRCAPAAGMRAKVTGWTRTGWPPRHRPTTSSRTLSSSHNLLPPDQVHDRIALWHNARKSLRKIRVQLIGELDAMVHQLPEELRCQLPTTNTVRARINSLAKMDTSAVTDPVVQLRLQLLDHRLTMLREVLAQDKVAETELAALVTQAGSTLPIVPGIAPRAAAEILLETGDIRRFTEAGFARFNGTAPIPATSGEAGGEPVRHRLNRGGNRRLNATLHRAAMIQLRCEPRARQLHDRAASTATPAGKPCASSSGTSPTSSIAPCSETSTRQPS